MDQSEILPAQERIIKLDVLRGFAMLGIYIMIIHGFNSSIPYQNEIFSQYDKLDRLIDLLNMVLISNRFVSIFSLLFGIGVAILETRFRRKGGNFVSYFLKRMSILAAFGLINTTFFFWGEILLTYAIFGVVTLFLSRFLSWKALLGIALIWFLVYYPIFDTFFQSLLIGKLQFFLQEYPFETLVEVYRNGSLMEMIRVRWIEYRILYTGNSFIMGLSLALMITGYVIGKKEWHLWFIQNYLKTKKIFNLAITYSVIFGVYMFVTWRVSFSFSSGWPFVFYLLFILSCLFSYVYLIISLSENSRIARWLAGNGKLSLTGYMGAACIFSFIFHNNGLGLYQEYGAAGQTIIALSVYLLFTVFSNTWLRKFKYGPMEWIYRKFSYGRI